MDSMSVARRYFDAWNQRNPSAIVSVFRDDGTYRDPASQGLLTGETIAQYAAGLFAAFPDLQFDIVTAARAADRMVAAQWVMRGANRDQHVPEGTCQCVTTLPERLPYW